MAANNVQVCKEHDNCECKHYCKDCKKNICLVCTLIGEHSKHNHSTIVQAVTEFRNGVKETSEAVDQMIKGLDDGFDKIEKMKTKIREHGNALKSKIDEHYSELEQKLKKQREQVKQQVTEAVIQKENTLETRLTTVRQAKSEMLNMVKMKNALEKNSDQEALSNNAAKHKQMIDECLQKLKPNHHKINLEPRDIDDIQLFPSRSLFPEFCYLLVGGISTNCISELLIPDKVYLNDKVAVTLLTRDFQGHYFSEGGNQVSMQLKSSKGKITTVEVKDNCDGSYVALFEGEQVGVSKLAVSINGQEIVGSPYDIVVHRNYRMCNSVKGCSIYYHVMGDHEPWGVAFGRYGVWAVASNSNHCVHVFDGQDKFIRKIGSSGANNGEVNAPRGITFDNENHLYVVDSGNHRVQKFGISGNYLLQIGCHDLNDGQLKDPYGITAHNGRIYVADYGNHRISVFHSDGQFCISFGSGQLGGPYDVAVNGNNQLLVADHSHKCIVTFTLDGHYVGKFDTQRPSGDQLCGPCCVTTDENSYILVVECGSDADRVSIFDHSGNLIHYIELNPEFYRSRSVVDISTGGRVACSRSWYSELLPIPSYSEIAPKSSDSEVAQVITARSIAFRPNGSIYVSDQNNRIRIINTE